MKTESIGKRLAKNTAYMYVRMVILTVITLYTSRIVLQQLGVDDFGIYGVIGSVVAMFPLYEVCLHHPLSALLTTQWERVNLTRYALFSTCQF